MEALEQRIFSMVDRDRLPHGLLFVGSPQSHKEDVALTLAQKLVCQAEVNLRPCQTCSACQNASEQNHPDVREVRPEKQEITIDQVRELQRWIHVGPYEAKRKIALIHEAHTLNLAAANSLLKTLEEPPAYANVILTTTSPDRLPRTVHSRLMLIRFSDLLETSASEEVPPTWLEELKNTLASPEKLAPEEVFSLTQKLGKERSELNYFFATFEACLRDKLVMANSQKWPNHATREIEKLFDQTIDVEGQVLRRYGNIGLNLDRLLLAYHALPMR